MRIGSAVVLLLVLLTGTSRGEESARDLLRQAQAAANQSQSAEAVKLLNAALEKDSELAVAYYVRGREQFRLGKIKESVADFDRYVKLEPTIESQQWERGIAYYYAKEYEKGAKQFELYQTYHDQDVENSVWRFLCMAPKTGVAKARSVMLPIENDMRVPMMQVYELFRGNLKVDDVLAAAKSGEPAADVLAGRMFYAQLYIGLYYEAEGNQELARKYILMAADDHKMNRRVNRYMWDVARIHADLLRKRSAE